MAKVYITEYKEMPLSYGNMPCVDMPPLSTQVVAITAGSVPSVAFSSLTNFVGVHVDTTCSIEFGLNPTATSNSRRFPPNLTEYFKVKPGHKLAVISNT